MADMKATKSFEMVCDGSSGDQALEQEMASHFLSVFEIFKKKQASYGPGNISEFGLKGVIIRMNDKMKRLIKIGYHGDPNPLGDETLDDTLTDMADYAVIAMVVRAGRWPGAK